MKTFDVRHNTANRWDIFNAEAGQRLTPCVPVRVGCSMTHAELLELAKRFPPPPEWFDEEPGELFVTGAEEPTNAVPNGVE